MANALYTIAFRIEQAWPERPVALTPYLAALRCMVSGDDRVGTLTGRMAVRRLLIMAHSWNGPLADALKKDLSEAVDAEGPALPIVILPAETCPVCGSRLDKIGAAMDIAHLSGPHLLMCAVCAQLTGLGSPSAVYRHGRHGWTRLDHASEK